MTVCPGQESVWQSTQIAVCHHESQGDTTRGLFHMHQLERMTKAMMIQIFVNKMCKVTMRNACPNQKTTMFVFQAMLVWAQHQSSLFLIDHTLIQLTQTLQILMSVKHFDVLIDWQLLHASAACAECQSRPLIESWFNFSFWQSQHC